MTFTTQAGLAYLPGARVRVASSASPTNFVEGVCTSYAGTTLALNTDIIGGSGSYSSWNLNIAGQVGASSGVLNFYTANYTGPDSSRVIPSSTSGLVFPIVTSVLDTATGDIIDVRPTVSPSTSTVTFAFATPQSSYTVILFGPPSGGAGGLHLSTLTNAQLSTLTNTQLGTMVN
jgi:hypothetical protein